MEESTSKKMANTAEHFLKKFKLKVKGIKLHHILLLALVGFLIGFIWFFRSSGAVSTIKTKQRFVIEPGAGASLVGQNLQKQGLVKNSLAFKLYVQLTGKSAKIQAGEYLISPNLNLFDLVTLLQQGPEEVWVTIPEGLRREEISLKMANGLALEGLPKDQFVKDFLAKSQNQEGYLFPDTYLLPRDITGGEVVNVMKSTFTKRVDFKYSSQAIIMASILERETLNSNERPIVAGILFKRLSAGWAIQADATVQYAVGTANCVNPLASCDWWPRPLTQADLDMDSSYNTYLYPGLPPAPISNPGLTSIKAAVDTEDSPYWYYIHDPEGNIHYATTIEEHNANIEKYLNN